MNFGFVFFFNSILLGIGLAMDAFSVSLANGLHEPRMKRGKMCQIAGVFAVFQALMPMIGWICVHTIVQYFQAFASFVPWIALGLLGFIGGKMLYEGITSKEDAEEKPGVGFVALMIQGIATSIDALSVGFTIADYDFLSAALAAFIIALVTFVIYMGGLITEQQAGNALSGNATEYAAISSVLTGRQSYK